MDRGQLFRAWVHVYLKEHIKKPFCWVHLEWFRLVMDRLVGIAAPRGLGKSTFFSVFYPLYLILEERKQVVLVSSSMRVAEKFMAMVVREIERNALILRDYGEQRGDKWTNEWIKLKDGGELQCIGSDGKIRGMRPDVLIIDDVENDENVRSEDYRKKLKDRFQKAWYYTLKPNGQVLVIGTLLHPLSLLSEIIDKQSGFDNYTAKKYAMLVNEKHEPDLKGVSVWEAQWPTALMYEERDNCLEAFEQERMNNPIPDELRKFSEADITYYEKLILPVSYTMTIDPAVDITSENDYTAFVVVATHEDGTMFVVEAYRKRMEPGEVIDKMFQLYNIYRPWVIGLEDVAISKLYRKYFELEAKKRHEYPNLQPMKLDMSRSGRSKQYRIEALRPFFRQGRIKILKDHIDLRGELLSFPTGRHDDICFVAETKVSTKYGYKSIKNIVIGDEVITPLGYSKVVASRCTGRREVIDKIGLKATPNHPVFTNNGFIPIDALTLSDEISKFGFKEGLLWRYKKLLSSMESNIVLWGRENIIFLSQRQTKEGSLLKDFMWQFGNFIIKRQFLKGFSFITKIATLSITTSLIWSVFHIANTINSEGLARKFWNTLKEYVLSLKNGTLLNQVVNNIVSKLRNNGRILQFIKENVNIAKRFLMPATMTPDFVVTTADFNTTLKSDDINAILYARNVEKNLNQTINFAREVSVPQVVEQISDGKVDVYNITTEAGVYYANDILVSNCDALALNLELAKPARHVKQGYPPGSFGEFWENHKRKKKQVRFHQWVTARHQRLLNS